MGGEEGLFAFACTTVAKVCSILNKFKKLGVVHRQISASSIRVQERLQVWKFHSLDEFDLAIVLKKKDHKVTQKIHSTRLAFLAPEIRNGEPHDFKADIWALGQVAYQIMSQQGAASGPIFDVNDPNALWRDDVLEEYK